MKKDYFALWSILAVAFVIFLTLSMCDDINIHLKSSGMADALTTPPGGKTASLTEDSVQNSDTAMTVEQNLQAAVDPNTFANDTTPKTVLFIGDSMVECLGPRMAAYCKAAGHRIYNVIWYSSTTELYGTTHLLADYVEAVDPDFIFISLGGNELFIRDIIEKRDKYVKTILSEIGNRPYIWIAPPNWKPDTGINELLANNIDKGCLFVSNGIKLARKKDGAHPNAEASIDWMDSIARWIPQHALYKLPLGKPQGRKTERATKVILHQPGELSHRPKKADFEIKEPEKQKTDSTKTDAKKQEPAKAPAKADNKTTTPAKTKSSAKSGSKNSSSSKKSSTKKSSSSTKKSKKSSGKNTKKKSSK